MREAMNSRELYAACRVEDPEAWKTVYHIVMGAIRRDASNLTRQDVEEIAQNSMLDILRLVRSGQVRSPNQFVNLCLNLSVWRKLDYVRASPNVEKLFSDLMSDREVWGGSFPWPKHGEAKRGSRSHELYRLMCRVLEELESWGHRTCTEVLRAYFRHKAGDPELASMKDVARALRRKYETIGHVVWRCIRAFPLTSEVRSFLRSST